MTEQMADYSDVVTVDQLDAALRAAGCQSVWHYLGDAFARREEDPDVVAGIRARGWPQGGIFVVRTPGLVDPAGDVARTRAYGYPPGSRLVLDIEPSQFDLDPGGWAVAADAWCDGVRAAGFSPGPYGVDRTVAACGNHADFIFRAVPGMCDPAAAGPQGLNPDYKPGVRIVQCRNGDFAGVNLDVSVSQITMGGSVSMATIDDVYQKVVGIDVEVGAGYVDNGIAAVLLRTVAALADAAAQLAAGQKQILDAIAGLASPTTDPAAAQGIQDRLTAVQTELDAKLADLATRQAALATHLGEGSP